MLVSCRRLLPALFLSGLASAQLTDDSFLGEKIVRENQVQNVLGHQPVKQPECRHVPTGPIEMTKCDYESVESVTDDLYNNLHELVTTPFFRFFRADLYRDCPFWTENGFCMNRECGITTVDESEIPEKWRAASLSKVEMPPENMRNSLPGCYYKDSDYCFLDDHSEGDYVDLIANPEQFTGYAGASANKIWSTIYNENCFGISELDALTKVDSQGASLAGGLAESGTDSEQCLEKRVYYKIISGLHASISIHLCHDWFNQTSGEWTPNLECFVSRVASHPERLKYVYFNNVLMMRAVARLGPYLSAYDYCSCDSETHDEDKITLSRLNKVIEIAKNVGQFDESVLFQGENANIVKEEFKTHFRNVSRIMDCVGCDKCRLWGKVQTSGVATALKVLFEMDEKALDPTSNSNLLTRSEVVALINTMHRFTESLYYVNNFRKQWSEALDEESERLIKEAARAITSAPQMKATPNPLLTYEEIMKAYPKSRIWSLIALCKKGTTECVNSILRVIDSLVSTLSSLIESFKTDKSAVPHPDL